MKRPDPKACAQALADIRDHGIVVALQMHIDRAHNEAIREALEFCARAPDYWVIVQKGSTSARVTYARETLVDCDEEMVACYRIETEGGATDTTETTQERDAVQARLQAFERIVPFLAKLEPTERLIVLDALARLEGGHLVKPGTGDQKR